MGKHAYCIIAHRDPYCLRTLISLIDDKRNDIYILIDKKSDFDQFKGLESKHSNLIIIPENQRIDIRWGGLSQVKAELILFRTAVEKGKYDFIHLLSGADLLLKSQDYIHNFFDSKDKDSNFIVLSSGKSTDENIHYKTDFYHLYIEYQHLPGDKNSLFEKSRYYVSRVIKHSVLLIQKLFKFKRNWGNLKIYKASNWVSLSQSFSEYLVENEEKILKLFRWVSCSDELYKPTMLLNSKFKDTLWKNEKGKIESLRLIDWKRGTPYTWRLSDFQNLIDSRKLFARKFSSEIDGEIIAKIHQHVLGQSTQNS